MRTPERPTSRKVGIFYEKIRHRHKYYEFPRNTKKNSRFSNIWEWEWEFQNKYGRTTEMKNAEVKLRKLNKKVKFQIFRQKFKDNKRLRIRF